MIKRIGTVLLAAVIACCLTACDAGDSQASEDTQNGAAENSAENGIIDKVISYYSDIREPFSSNVQSCSGGYGVSDDEVNEILLLLGKTSDFLYLVDSCKGTCRSVSETDFITVETPDGSSKNYDETYFLLDKGELTTSGSLNSAVDALFTENGKEELSLEHNYKARDGKLYLRKDAGQDGGLLGTDSVTLEKAEYIDKGSIELELHAFGSKDNWESETDYNDDFTITLKKTENGFKIDKLGLKAISYITWVPVAL